MIKFYQFWVSQRCDIMRSETESSPLACASPRPREAGTATATLYTQNQNRHICARTDTSHISIIIYRDDVPVMTCTNTEQSALRLSTEGEALCAVTSSALSTQPLLRVLGFHAAVRDQVLGIDERGPEDDELPEAQPVPTALHVRVRALPSFVPPRRRLGVLYLPARSLWSRL